MRFSNIQRVESLVLSLKACAHPHEVRLTRRDTQAKGAAPRLM